MSTKQKAFINERRVIDAIIKNLEVSNGDAQSIYEAAELTRPELFGGQFSEAEIIQELCR